MLGIFSRVGVGVNSYLLLRAAPPVAGEARGLADAAHHAGDGALHHAVALGSGRQEALVCQQVGPHGPRHRLVLVRLVHVGHSTRKPIPVH